MEIVCYADGNQRSIMSDDIIPYINNKMRHTVIKYVV